MDRISAMRVFSEVVTRGSFTAAASTLGMSRAMVTRHIAELERWLGASLLQRSTRRLSLTEAGEACVVRSRQLLELVNDVEQVVGQHEDAEDDEIGGPLHRDGPGQPGEERHQDGHVEAAQPGGRGVAEEGAHSTCSRTAGSAMAARSPNSEQTRPSLMA